MRDKAKKYLLEAYIADWAPKPEQVPQLGPTIRVATAPRPPKQNKGFLDDTDDEDDVDEGNVYIV